MSFSFFLLSTSRVQLRTGFARVSSPEEEEEEAGPEMISGVRASSIRMVVHLVDDAVRRSHAGTKSSSEYFMLSRR